ncbi:DUF4388 domain-containing protein [Anaeromyxobacter oryzae]|uniref:PatA-like N-terminal domain-containing protein n=1 Tax=Anaeromyxobacter oryzae TaxID=2918170 RepID=A0ABN6MS47_9BACT|nr:DUF4388 domain-containing protein [Anaeromyxobacter oryzae]BDG02553.1 hypothetical protein AMOR_15490 [Anaeromyxobacter oryzae]
MALVLDIDAHGRLVPQSDEVRRALADRAGRFALLPSAPDLVVARRTPAVGGVAPRPRCFLAGDLAGFPIADFIAFVHQSRLSGVLTVASAGAERAIAFKDGEVRNARSTGPGERVGEVAVRLGFVTDAQVAQCAGAGAPLGRALVDKGILSANDLWKCLHEQVTAVFHAILLAADGTFHMIDEDVTDRPGTPLAVSTQSLLMDGIRRIDEMSLFRARIPSAQAYLRRREPKRAATLKPAEQSLLALVDGRRTVAEVATAAHLSEFDATKILYHLAEAGHVEAVAAPAAAADPGARLAAIASGMNAVLRLAAAAIPEPGRPAFLAAVRAFLADGQHALSPVWSRAAHGNDGAVDETTVLANVAAIKGAVLARLEPSADPARLLFEALRELLFFYLFLAGERIGRDADEALGLAVKARLVALEGLVEGAR